MSGLGDKMKPPGSAVHGDTNEGPTFGTIIMETVSFLSGRFPDGFCTNTSSMTGPAVPHRSVSHAWGWILTHPNAQVAAKPTILICNNQFASHTAERQKHHRYASKSSSKSSSNSPPSTSAKKDCCSGTSSKTRDLYSRYT